MHRDILPPAGTRRGFTFLEILIVMAVMAVLMGIGVGYLQNIGAGSRAAQARAILRETIFACKQSSNGGTRAILDLRGRPSLGPDALVVGASVARPVLTHNFEELDAPSLDYPVDVEGKVEIAPEGFTGRAARFGVGGMLVFAPQAAFAVTDGFHFDVRLKIESGAPIMTLIKGEGAYEVALVKDTRRDAYDVYLYLYLTSADDDTRAVGVRSEFPTKDAPLVPGRGWTHLEVGYDGRAASIRIDGIEHLAAAKKLRPTTPSETATGVQRIVVPAGGAVTLKISDPSRPFTGLLDNLVLGGVFRSQDTERELFGLVLEHPSAPLRVVYRNGRLDPEEHSDDVVLLFSEAANPDGPVLEFRLGLYGTVGERLVMRGAQ